MSTLTSGETSHIYSNSGSSYNYSYYNYKIDFVKNWIFVENIVFPLPILFCFDFSQLLKKKGYCELFTFDYPKYLL